MQNITHNLTIPIYLELGSKKVFAAALDWPGWSRSGRDETGALTNLLTYAGRYARVLSAAGLKFTSPEDLSSFDVVERLPGNFDTNFGTPGKVPTSDSLPLMGDELKRQQAILDACWQVFSVISASAVGKTLRLGPRGGGRDLEAIRRHVLGGSSSYLRSINWKFTPGAEGDTSKDLLSIQAACREALEVATQPGMPESGPHGGVRWKPRYFVRRSAWHILDHAWEIEDRMG